MSTALQKADGGGAVVLQQEQIQILKDTVCKGATNAELQHFVQVCNRLQLDPFRRQIHAVKRWDAKLRREVMTHQTSIDGLRVIAERSGRYEGQTPYQWCGADGKWLEVWLSSQPPLAARVGVYRKGFREAIYNVAKYDSYVQTTKDGKPNSMWRKMPDNQLAKCAEALALRRAFPDHIGGVYTDDEMGQADADNVYLPPAQEAVEPMQWIQASETLEQLEEAGRRIRELGLNGSKRAVKDAYKARYMELQKHGAQEPAPEPEHNPKTGEVVDAEYDYGPPPMSEEEVARAEAAAGGR